MRHRHGLKKMGRNGSHRLATLRNMATALFRHRRITTTLVKAKALRPFAERLITLAKRGDLHARRLAARHIHDHVVLQQLFADIGSHFQNRAGGYTRIFKLGLRRGDCGSLALIELAAAAAPEIVPSASAPAPTPAPSAAAP